MSVVASAHYDSPIGPLTVAVTSKGVAKIAFADLQTPSSAQSPAVDSAAQKLLKRSCDQLDQYFAGGRKTFELPLDLSAVRGEFAGRVLEETAAVPYGTTVTYAELAQRAGSAGAVRAVGNAMATNPLPLLIPCHRVLRTGGGVGNYAGGQESKRLLLRLEGVEV